MSKQQPNQSRQKPDNKSVQTSRQAESGAPQLEQVQLGAIQAAMADPTQASRKAVRGAQRAYGNQHVQRAIQRRQVARRMQVNEPDDQYEKEAEAVADSLQRSPAAAAAPGNNGGGPADPAGSAPTDGAVQRAMTVSSPEDPLEKEAEEVADSLQRSPEHVPPVGEDGGSSGGGDGDSGAAARNVARQATGSEGGGVASAPNGKAHRPVPTQLSGNLFQRQEELGEEELALSPETPSQLPPVAEGASTLQRSGDGMDSQGNVHDDVSRQIDRKRGSGQPLTTPVQRRMEGHLGADFSNVRVHTDGESDTLNRSLQAEAFTTGTDIFFSRGAYEPGSQGGQQLLAHELTHVVQQGGAPAGAQRQEEEEEVQRQPSETPAIQRAGDDEAEAKTKEKAVEGRDQASGKKNEQEGKKKEAEGTANGDAVPVAAPIVPKIPPPPAARDIPGVAENNMLNSAEREMPEAVGGDELGVLGWPLTKEMALPDWDDEVAKYDAFKSGDFEALGADMSALEGYAIGLGDPITVDDPEVRARMVADALAGGLNGGDAVGPLNFMKGYLLDSIPFAGTIASLGTLFTKGPGEWFGEMTGGVSNAAKNIGNAWKGLGEGSGWNRAASAIELMIGIMELLNSIVQFISAIALIVTIVGAIFIGIGMALLSFIFTAAAGASLISFWTSPTIIAGKILLICAAYLVSTQLLIRTLREIAIAFRIIDMLYYESDPEKLMERQAKLAEHSTALNQAGYENLRMGIRDDEEKGLDEEKVGTPPWEEGMADPEVIDPGIERVSRMSDDEKQDYRAQWLEKYGIDSTADQVRDELANSETEPPPLLEYRGDPIEDVVGRIDRNAVAIYELERQELMLLDEENETTQATEVGQQQVETLGAARQSVAENQRMADEHQKDIDVKLQKQDDLKGQSQETEKTGQKGQGESTEAKGLAAIILALLKPIMPAVKASGEGVSGEKEGQTNQGGEQGTQVTDTTVDSAQESQKEADLRKEQTKKTKTEATASQRQLDDTGNYLESNQEQAEEGVAGLQSLQGDIAAMREEVAVAKQELMDERTQAIADAMDWMISWREQREALFEQMEGRLQTLLPDQPQEDEEGAEESNEEKADFDFYDEEKDQGKLKGYYGTSDIEGEYDPEDGEQNSDDLEQFALDC